MTHGIEYTIKLGGDIKLGLRRVYGVPITELVVEFPNATPERIAYLRSEDSEALEKGLRIVRSDA